MLLCFILTRNNNGNERTNKTKKKPALNESNDIK